jgi:hypothetical protein
MDAKPAWVDRGTDLQALAQAILDNTDEAQALTKTIQATCDTLLRRLDEPVLPGLQGALEEILDVMRADKQPAPVSSRWLVGCGLGLVLLSGALTWYVSHCRAGSPPAVLQRRAVLMEHVNAVLVERYSSLPADLKAKLTTVYSKQGFALERPPGGKP